MLVGALGHNMAGSCSRLVEFLNRQLVHNSKITYKLLQSALLLLDKVWKTLDGQYVMFLLWCSSFKTMLPTFWRLLASLTPPLRDSGSDYELSNFYEAQYLKYIIHIVRMSNDSLQRQALVDKRRSLPNCIKYSSNFENVSLQEREDLFAVII